MIWVTYIHQIDSEVHDLKIQTTQLMLYADLIVVMAGHYEYVIYHIKNYCWFIRLASAHMKHKYE